MGDAAIPSHAVGIWIIRSSESCFWLGPIETGMRAVLDRHRGDCVKPPHGGDFELVPSVSADNGFNNFGGPQSSLTSKQTDAIDMPAKAKTGAGKLRFSRFLRRDRPSQTALIWLVTAPCSIIVRRTTIERIANFGCGLRPVMNPAWQVRHCDIDAFLVAPAWHEA